MRHWVGWILGVVWGIGAPVARADLGEDIRDLLAQTGYQPSEYTVLITGDDGAQPEIIFEHNTVQTTPSGETSPVLRAPASLQKILLTSTALEKFGVGYQFATEVRRSGDDVCLVGHGDPSLSTQTIRSMARSVRESGLHAIEGDLILDESMFPGERPYSEDFEADFEKPHAGFIGALSLNENRVSFSAKPGRSIGAPANIEVYPELHGLQFTNRAKTVKSLRSRNVGFDLSSVGEDYRFVASGSIGMNQTKGVWSRKNVDDPAQFTGRAFLAAYLSPEEGLPASSFSGRILRRTKKAELLQCEPENSSLVHVQRSVRLGDVLGYMNQESVNFVAEMIMMAMADRYPCNDRNQEICDWLYYRAGIENDEYYPFNSSGLYREKVIDAWTLQRSMLTAKRLYGADFVENLGRPGEGDEGWLRKFFQKSDVQLRKEQRVFAKTGSIRRVANLAGFAFEDGKNPFVFVFFFDDDPNLPRRSLKGGLSAQEAMEKVILRVFASR